MANGQKWLGLTLALALALSALLPFFAIYNPSGHAVSAFGERILICSGDGFRWVKLSDLQNGREKPAPHSGDKCPLCYMARHGVSVMPVASAMPAPVYPPRAAAFAYYNRELVSPYRASPLNMRAPPVSFIS
jgi:hypothetical protein